MLAMITLLQCRETETNSTQAKQSWKRALAAMASAARSGPAGGAENLGYRSLQHYAHPSALGQRRWLGWSCSCSGCSGRQQRL